MRDIKFRAWDGKMMYPVLSLTNDSNANYFNPAILYNNEPIMQYTGLKDKNGVEIFDGDIVNIKFTNRDLGGVEELKSKPIIWSEHNCSFAVDNGEWHEGLNGIIDIEVIGNIYENPDLLTKEAA